METSKLIRQLMQNKAHQKTALREDFMLSVTARICELMREKRMSRSDLAKELNVSRANVTKLLCGERNMTLCTLADLLFVLGRRADFRDVPFTPEELIPGHESKNDPLVIQFEAKKKCMRIKECVGDFAPGASSAEAI